MWRAEGNVFGSALGVARGQRARGRITPGRGAHAAPPPLTAFKCWLRLWFADARSWHATEPVSVGLSLLTCERHIARCAGSTEEVTSNDILRALGERVPGEDEEGEEGEAGEGEAGEGEEGAVQQYDAGEGEYDEGEGEYDEYDEGEYEQEEGVVDVDALPSDDEDAPRKGGRGGRR